MTFWFLDWHTLSRPRIKDYRNVDFSFPFVILFLEQNDPNIFPRARTGAYQFPPKTRCSIVPDHLNCKILHRTFSSIIKMSFYSSFYKNQFHSFFYSWSSMRIPLDFLGTERPGEKAPHIFGEFWVGRHIEPHKFNNNGTQIFEVHPSLRSAKGYWYLNVFSHFLMDAYTGSEICPNGFFFLWRSFTRAWPDQRPLPFPYLAGRGRGMGCGGCSMYSSASGLSPVFHPLFCGGPMGHFREGRGAHVKGVLVVQLGTWPGPQWVN